MTAQEVVTVIAAVGILLMQLAALVRGWHLAVITQREGRAARKSRRVLQKKVDHVARKVNSAHDSLVKELQAAHDLVARLEGELAALDRKKGEEGATKRHRPGTRPAG